MMDYIRNQEGSRADYIAGLLLVFVSCALGANWLWAGIEKAGGVRAYWDALSAMQVIVHAVIGIPLGVLGILGLVALYSMIFD